MRQGEHVIKQGWNHLRQGRRALQLPPPSGTRIFGKRSVDWGPWHRWSSEICTSSRESRNKILHFQHLKDSSEVFVSLPRMQKKCHPKTPGIVLFRTISIDFILALPVTAQGNNDLIRLANRYSTYDDVIDEVFDVVWTSASGGSPVFLKVQPDDFNARVELLIIDSDSWVSNGSDWMEERCSTI